jgi:sugar lactone lactonase YvrE
VVQNSAQFAAPFWKFSNQQKRGGGYSLALSFNQPKFCSNPSWNPNATTFAGSNIIGSSPVDIFIDTNNTIYVPNRDNGQIIVWPEGFTAPTRSISVNSSSENSLFVTTTGDIYVDTFNLTGGVSEWTSNSTIGVLTMSTCQRCWDLFIDISNNLYCSMGDLNQVFTKSLNDGSNTLKIVAGTGSSNSTSTTLNSPRGIFVDTNFDLYVADCFNNRIQLFQSGQLSATTVAGSGSSTITIVLNLPTGIVLDADKNLFIVDSGNNRIVASGFNGFQCLVGCNGSGSSLNILNYPQNMAFDSYGNMFVTDKLNNRIQKFTLTTSLCSKFNKIKETLEDILINY